MQRPREDPMAMMDRVHQGADIPAHAQVLFGGLPVAGKAFFPLFLECMKATQTASVPWKILRRAQRAYHLARYVERAAGPGAGMAECGVFHGFSALLACRVRAALDPSFRGAGTYLIDSFEGLSESRDQDLVDVVDAAGRPGRIASHKAGHFAVALEQVRARFAPFPEVSLVKGWIPESLAQLPERQWSFVHIDVDLYEPTRGALEYFYPRLAPGGIILNDDFGSPYFPGAGRAWMEFFDALPAPYVVLDTGQSVYMAPAAPAT